MRHDGLADPLGVGSHGGGGVRPAGSLLGVHVDPVVRPVVYVTLGLFAINIFICEPPEFVVCSGWCVRNGYCVADYAIVQCRVLPENCEGWRG